MFTYQVTDFLVNCPDATSRSSWPVERTTKRRRSPIKTKKEDERKTAMFSFNRQTHPITIPAILLGMFLLAADSAWARQLPGETSHPINPYVPPRSSSEQESIEVRKELISILRRAQWIGEKREQIDQEQSRINSELASLNRQSQMLNRIIKNPGGRIDIVGGHTPGSVPRRYVVKNPVPRYVIDQYYANREQRTRLNRRQNMLNMERARFEQVRSETIRDAMNLKQRISTRHLQ